MSLPLVSPDGGVLKISLYDDTQREQLLALLKEVSAPFVSVEEEGIFCHPNKEVLIALKNYGVYWHDRCLAHWSYIFKPPSKLMRPDNNYVKHNLYAHQKLVYERYLEQAEVYLNPEMGLGKTKVSLDLAVTYFINGLIKNLLVVAPKSVLLSWAEEYVKHLNANIYNRVDLNKKHPFLSPDKLNIFEISAETLSRDVDKNPKIRKIREHIEDNNTALIIDEAHYFKNRAAARVKNTSKLLKEIKFPFKFFLSGTPVTKDVEDMWAQMNLLAPGSLGKYFTVFKKEHCVTRAVPGVFITYKNGVRVPKEVTVGVCNIAGFHKKIDPYVLTMAQKRVFTLPPERTIVKRFSLPPKNMEEYKFYESKGFLVDKGEAVNGVTHALAKALKLQEIANGWISEEDEATGTKSYRQLDKNQTKNNLLLDLIEQTGDAKSIVWAARKYSQEQIYTHLRDNLQHAKVFLYNSALTNKQRVEMMDAFKSHKGPGVLVTSAAIAGTGLNLTFCNTTFFYDLPAQYAQYVQAKARVYRIGQKLNVTHYVLVAENTINEKHHQAMNKKKNLVDVLFNAKEEK